MYTEYHALDIVTGVCLTSFAIKLMVAYFFKNVKSMA